MWKTLLARCHTLDKLPVPRPFRFLLVGLSGVGVNMGVLLLLLSWTGLAPLLAASLAVEASICGNFVLNDIWTFGAATRIRPWWARATAFHVTAAIAAGINLGLFLALTSVAGVPYLGANLIAIAVASVINFGMSASWTWRGKPSPIAEPAPNAYWEQGAPSRRIVVIPTYNENANIRRLLERILSLGREYEALVVDDSSPDGTGEIVEAMAAREPRIQLIRRDAKAGLASAYVCGFRRALALGADLIYQMDGDFSHNPDDLPHLGEAVTPSNVVIGSRYVSGGSTPGWPLYRIVLSRVPNYAARILLRLPVHDATGGFKCWSRQVLASLPLDSVRSSGFAFQVEMNYLAWRLGFPLVEVPITFGNRKAGRSKASLGIGIEMAATVCRLFLAPAPVASLASRLPKES